MSDEAAAAQQDRADDKLAIETGGLGAGPSQPDEGAALMDSPVMGRVVLKSITSVSASAAIDPALEAEEIEQLAKSLKICGLSRVSNYRTCRCKPNFVYIYIYVRYDRPCSFNFYLCSTQKV